jgi:hypothetical protein
MVYQAGSNNYLGGDRPKKYKLIVSCCLFFVCAELVEIITLETLVLGA